MKQLIILTTLFITTTTTLFAQNAERDCIIAKSVELYMNTSFSVQCDNFERALGKLATTHTIFAKDSLKIFSAFVSTVKFAKRTENIDVRCKFVYKSGDLNKNTICTDGRNIVLNGRMIKRNRKFIAFLNSIINDSVAVNK